MTDKQKIRAEIERRMKTCEEAFNACPSTAFGSRIDSYKALLSFIDSLPEEPASEDLEKAAKHYLYGAILYDDVYVGNPTEEDCIRCFKAGAEWQKQQMMKELWHNGSDNPGNKHPYPVINPDTQEMAFAYYDQRFGLWEFDRDYNPGRNMLWLDIEKILPNLQEGGAQ